MSLLECTENKKLIYYDLREGEVFQRRTATESEAFSLLTCLDATAFVLLTVFTLLETIYLKICVKPLPMNAKRPPQVAVRRSKAPLFNLPIIRNKTGLKAKTVYQTDEHPEKTTDAYTTVFVSPSPPTPAANC